MLDLFKNIINKKAKDHADLVPSPSTTSSVGSSSTITQNNADNRTSSSTSPSPPLKDGDEDTNNPIHAQKSVNELLEHHPELTEYYTELHTRYLLSNKIGEGAFSVVYKGYDSNEQRHLAIKIINKSKMNQEQLNSTMKEIAIMRQLKHPNIVKMYNYQNSATSTYCFLFLEYIQGGEIFNQIIKYTYFSENLSRHVLRQVAFAVKYLHDNGIVHRDIKPENLLFEPTPIIKRSREEQLKARRVSDDDNKVDEGTFSIENGSGEIGLVKLADFGLSTQLYSQNSLAKTPCGTIGYTSPEQHMNIGYDKKVDMWALGCVLYTMVVGFPPFYSSTQDANAINEKVMKGDYQFLKPWFDEVSDGCKSLISNLLTVDPAKRYSIDELLLDPWLNVGYEDACTLDKLRKTASPAEDIPKSTFDNDLYKAFSEDLISTENVSDYFTGPKVNSDDIQTALLTPRAEAIKLVFDTAKATVCDVMGMRSNRSDSISDLDSEDSYDSDGYNSNTSARRLRRFEPPHDIQAGIKHLSDNDSFDDDDDDDDDDDEDDLSLDSELDGEDTDDYPITLTSLSKTKSPMIRRTHGVESSTYSCLTPVHSHGTTATVTTLTTTAAPSLKSKRSYKSLNSHKSISSMEIPRSTPNTTVTATIVAPGCHHKPSIMLVVDEEHAKRSGSITSNSSHLSDLSASSITSAPSNGSGANLKLDYHPNKNGHAIPITVSDQSNMDMYYHGEDAEDVESDEGDDDHNDTDREWEDKTPLAGLSFACLHKLTHEEFRSKCLAHTPYVFKKDIAGSSSDAVGHCEEGYVGEAESTEYTPPDEFHDEKLDTLSLEQKLQQQSVVELKLDTATILSRRKMKVGAQT
jgi:serine/threonine protein kinase